MSTFIDVENQKLIKYLEEKWKEKGNQAPKLTNKIHPARFIICDNPDTRYFKSPWVEKVKILNPNKEQLKTLQELESKFPWVEVEIKLIKL